MLSFNLDAMRAEILNHQSEVRSLPEELEMVKAELCIYHEMQESLNQALSGNPELLDYIEALQCGADNNYLLDITRYYSDDHSDLKAEVKRLHSELDDQERHIELQRVRMGKDVVSLYTYARKLAVCKATMEAYQHNCDLWRDAYNKLKQEQIN